VQGSGIPLCPPQRTIDPRMTEPTDRSASSSAPDAPPSGSRPRDLPPVEAPSAEFIIQLFVIPALVVLVVIVVWLLFGKLAGGERDAMEYVRLIRESHINPRAANRAAFELASLLQNDPKLASDARLLGELTDVLERDLDKVEDPRITQYVALALGRFHTLEAVSSSRQKIDLLSALDRALDEKYPEPVRIAAAASLAEHAARLEGKLDDPRPVAALVRASESGGPEFRQMAIYALGFFGGEVAAAGLRARLGDEDRFVRYNAAVALGRRGDPAAQAVLQEMLSSDDLAKLLPIDSESEKRSKIEAIALEAVNALQFAVDRRKPELAQSLRHELTALSKSGLVSVRNSAQAVLKSLPEAR
jgi:HEAT repeat protein